MNDQDEQAIIIGEDYFIEHFGTKGMKWGQRRARNRELNRASRKKDWQKQEQTVGKARERVQSGKTQAEFKKAKSQFKANKAELGSREARKILNKARDKKYKDLDTAQQAKNKKEAAVILGLVGGVLALQIAGAVARSR